MFWKSSFISWVFLVRLLVFEIWSNLYMVYFDLNQVRKKSLQPFAYISMQKAEENFANPIQMLTREGMVLNPKACGVQGHSPGGGRSLPPIFLAKWIKCFFREFFSKFRKWSYFNERGGICWIERKINFSIFGIF